MVRSVDGERGLLDLLFVMEIQHDELRDPGLKYSDVDEFVDLWIERGV
jgi:hypothetical protein